jgi:hypothetical protein
LSNSLVWKEFDKFAKKLYKNTSPMKWKYFLHWRHAFTPQMISKYISSHLITLLQTRNLANKIEEF